MSHWKILVTLSLAGGLSAAQADDLHELGFEQLMDLEVSTASRKEQPLSQTPAAAFVITREDIRRSGATCIPEALRLAPGVVAAQISASKWSVTIRGFNGRFANKLLVLLDGRTLYTPAFSGVYWEINEPPLDDIERIEVIRGPGGTLWGSNAVNGVINIITRSAADTQGTRVRLEVGSERWGASVRSGSALGEGGHLRLYAKTSDTQAFALQDGLGGDEDGFAQQQAGFRADWTGGTDQWTLQGDLTYLDQGQSLLLPAVNAPPTYSWLATDTIRVRAGNLLGRWERSLAANAEIQVQAYVDHYEREEITRQERVTTLDLDLQHRLAALGPHDLLWGLGYRHTEDNLDTNPVTMTGDPLGRSLNTFSGFLQDEIELVDERVWLTLGTKLEHNELTGLEWQPNARLLWTPDRDQSLWASVARAVRTPSFGERDYRVNTNVLAPLSASNPTVLPVLRSVAGNEGYGSEDLVAYELGYRRRLAPGLTLDAALFYNDYDQLLAARLDGMEFRDGYLVLLNPTYNDMEGHNYGAELALDWRPGETWRVQPSLTLLRSDFRIRSESNLSEAAKDLSSSIREGTDPEAQFSLRLGWSPRSDLDLDLWLRAVSEVPVAGYASGQDFHQVEEYLTLDLRAAWRPRPGLELALIGKNLFQPRHLESMEELYPVTAYVPRSLLATFTYEF